MNDDKRKNTPGEDENTDAAPAEEAAAEAGPESADAGAAQESGPGGWGRGELEALRQENAELKDRLLRTAAEMENLRRRTEREKADTAKYAISNFARDVLSIADNIARAIEHVPDEAAEQDPALKSFLDGMKVTERELHNMLERYGIARHDPKGERFDPNRHQAMFEIENKDVAEGTIVEVMQPGYVIAERVLRPALVGVSKGGPKPARTEEADTPAEAPRAANDDAAGQGPEPAAQAEGEEPKETKKKAGPKKRVGGSVDKSA